MTNGLRSPELQAQLSAWADEQIRDMIRDHDERFLQVALAEYEYQLQVQFEHLCHFTYHLMDAQDAEEADWVSRHETWLEQQQIDTARLLRQDPSVEYENG